TGYNNSVHYAPAGSGLNTATWQLAGLSAGGYDVQVTWPAQSNWTSSASYQVYDGTTLLTTVRVNQRLAPTGGATVNGTTFQSLGKFAISSGTLKVVLSDAGDGYVIADALRVAPLPAAVTDLNWA